MKLQDWFKTSGAKQKDFAASLGVAASRISQLTSGETPSLDLALKIRALTNGAVRPEDFQDTPAMPADTPTALDTVQDAIDAIARGEMVVVVDDDDRENEGDLIAAAVQDHAGADGLHGAPYLRHRLRADHAGGRPPPQARSHGCPQRRAHGHRLHCHHRLQGRPHHRHLGQGARRDGACARQHECPGRRFRPPRPHLPVRRKIRRRADALRPHGSRRRSRAALGAPSRRRHLRTGQRRRHR